MRWITSTAASREDVRLALSVVLCSEHRDRERFEEAFSAVFGDGRPRVPHEPSDDIAALGEIPQEVLPQAGRGRPDGGAGRA